jgi:hypothetical protein
MLFIIYFIIFLCILFNKKDYKDHYTAYIDFTFLSKDQLYDILREDEDKYYSRFYGNDFKTRNINNISDYIKIIYNSVEDFTDEEKNKLIRCIHESNKFFSSYPKTEWFNGNKANNIEWIFGIINGKDYERGLPHTRNNIIILSKEHLSNYSDEQLIKTLIHEKVHIYQKIYTDDIEVYLKKNNFTKIKIRDSSDNIRANPDLDEWIYKNNENQTLKAVYNNNPKNIEDIKYSPINIQSYEHPFEKMAIDIENSKK